jgi:hypothetical protein
MRLALTALLFAACGTSRPEPTSSRGPNDSNPSDAGVYPDADRDASANVDESLLGSACSLEQQCPSGAGCYRFAGIPEPRCTSDACGVLRCPRERCRIAKSYPAIAICDP